MYLTIVDLGFSGGHFAQCNRRERPRTISERLDRFMVNLEWQQVFLYGHVQHGFAAHSDHIPIILSTTIEATHPNGKIIF